MPPRVAGIAAACIAMLAVGPSAQTPVPVTVSGQVLDAVTGAPIGGAQVVLTKAAPPNPQRTVVADESGHFVFLDVPVGVYYLFASRSGYFTGGFGDALPRGASDEFIIDRQGPLPVTMKLWRHAAIAGIVHDDADRPVAGAKVNVLARQQVWPSWGKRLAWMPVADARTPVTGADGHYAIDAMEPGEYLIEIVAADVPIPGPVPTTFGTAYSPGVREISAAVPITLGVGERRAADVRLDPMPALDVSGVVDVPDPDGVSVFVQLFSTGDVDERHRGPLADQWLHTGRSFTFSRLPPGGYVLEANVNDRFWGEERITIVDRALRDVRIVLQPPLVVSGRVVWEGAGEPPDRSSVTRPGTIFNSAGSFKPSPEQLARLPIGLAGLLAVEPSRPATQFVRSHAAVWSVDSRFILSVPPGLFLAEDARLNGWFLKSLRINGHDATEEPVDIASGSTDAVLTLTRGVGEVHGTIVTGSGAPDLAGMAVLFSANPRIWPGMFATRGRMQMDGVDAAGHFALPDVLPGEYYLAAIAGTPWAEVDEEMLRRLALTALRVQVTPNASVGRTLRRAR